MGGNIFPGTGDIRKEYIKPTLEKYFEEMKTIFPDKKEIFNLEHFIIVGSAGKKDLSGDIDLAIDKKFISQDFSDKSIGLWGLDIDKVKEDFNKYKKRARTATDKELETRALLKNIAEKINNSISFIHTDVNKTGLGSMFSAFHQITTDNVQLGLEVQIDWLVGDIEWLKFSYYSNSYKKNIKGLHRTQLLISAFQLVNATFSHTRGVTDKSTKEVVARTPDEALKYLSDRLGIDISKEKASDYFSLHELLKKLSSENYNKLLNIYFNILSHTRADIPFDMQEDWKQMYIEHRYETKFLPPESDLYAYVYGGISMVENFRTFINKYKKEVIK